MNNISLIKRAIAYMIDLYLGTLLSTIPISLTTYYQFHQISQDITLFSKPISSILLLLSIFALILYFLVIPYFFHGQTIGKKIMKYKICYSSFSSLCIRQCIYMVCLTSLTSLIIQFISLFSSISLTPYINTFVFILSFVMIIYILCHRNHIALYDQLAKTVIQ